jgi:hypothetical protein
MSETFYQVQAPQEIIVFYTWNFGHNPSPWFFCPHVQLDQSVILDKLIWLLTCFVVGFPLTTWCGGLYSSVV